MTTSWCRLIGLLIVAVYVGIGYSPLPGGAHSPSSVSIPSSAPQSEQLETGTVNATSALAESPSMSKLMATEQLSVGMLLLALGVAMGLGALHALEPGHGKTVVAAYLVGTRGTARHALWLGLIVTITHTAGVYLLGVVTLYASAYIVPEELYPWLSMGSGVIVASLGIYLFVQRYLRTRITYTSESKYVYVEPSGHPVEHANIRAPVYAHAHASSHEHLEHHGKGAHGHHHHGHHHGHHHHDHNHGHHHLDPSTVTFRQLLTLGVTGGIVPCPAALVVLLTAVALHRVGLGLLLILTFSMGLAAVLIVIGLLMVYARRFMTRFQSEGPLITRWLPLSSAALITVFGVAMIIQALMSADV